VWGLIPSRRAAASYLADRNAFHGVARTDGVHDILARAVGLSTMRISHVVNCKRPVTAEMALLFGKVFGQTPQYWINLQAAYDLKTAEKAVGRRLEGIRELAHA
jgi:addiction module HigA family antidote